MTIEAAIAANRFGLGARPGELDRIADDPKGWLLEQLTGPARQPAELRKLPSSASALLDVQKVREMRRELRQSEDDEPAPDIVQEYVGVVRRHFVDQAHARYKVATATDYPFHERLVRFWSNHFAVSADKQPLPALAGLYENEAIRPNLGGSFADLLIAVETHPAMLVYLDNQRSIGPNSTLGLRANRRRNQQQVGLNENLAREILELHTLGVDGGYSQDDVLSLAKVITGWSVGGGERRFAEGTPGEFEFREVIHEPGSKTILGRTYREDGFDEGVAVLNDLAVHPSTARFIATKLATHFIADAPPATVVDEIAEVFLDTDGDLPSVHRALVQSAAAWTQPFAKYKSPEDFVVSTFRAFDRSPDDGRFVIGALDQLGQTPFRPGSPAGWPDTAEAWGGADALYKRIEWANAVGRLAGPRAEPIGIAEAALGPALGDHTRTAIARAESRSQGMTLFLMSPEFQRR